MGIPTVNSISRGEHRNPRNYNPRESENIPSFGQAQTVCSPTLPSEALGLGKDAQGTYRQQSITQAQNPAALCAPNASTKQRFNTAEAQEAQQSDNALQPHQSLSVDELELSSNVAAGTQNAHTGVDPHTNTREPNQSCSEAAIARHSLPLGLSWAGDCAVYAAARVCAAGGDNVQGMCGVKRTRSNGDNIIGAKSVTTAMVLF